MHKLTGRITYSSTGELVTTIVLTLSTILVFFCLNNSTMTVGSLVFAGVLLVFNFRKKVIQGVSPLFALAVFFFVSLAVSGRLFERGHYNIPWKYFIKFVHLSFAGVCALTVKYLPIVKRRLIMRGAIITIVISSLISIYYTLFVNSEAIRYRDILGITQTVSFDQILAIPIIAPVLLVVSFSYRRELWGKLLVLSAGIMYLCILRSLLTTVILLSALGLVLSYYLVVERGKKKKAAIVGLVAIVVAIFGAFRNSIGEGLYNMTSNLPLILKGRLRQVIDIVFGVEHQNAYSMSRRVELASYSINAFKQNFWFGVGIGGIGYGVIGYHQEWPDMLGVNGLIGTLIIVGIIIFFTSTLYSLCETKLDKRSLIVGMLLFIVLGFLDPCMFNPELFAVYVILPNISSLFEEAYHET